MFLSSLTENPEILSPQWNFPVSLAQGWKSLRTDEGRTCGSSHVKADAEIKNDTERCQNSLAWSYDFCLRQPGRGEHGRVAKSAIRETTRGVWADRSGLFSQWEEVKTVGRQRWQAATKQNTQSFTAAQWNITAWNDRHKTSMSRGRGGEKKLHTHANLLPNL